MADEAPTTPAAQTPATTRGVAGGQACRPLSWLPKDANTPELQRRFRELVSEHEEAATCLSFLVYTSDESSLLPLSQKSRKVSTGARRLLAKAIISHCIRDLAINDRTLSVLVKRTSDSVESTAGCGTGVAEIKAPQRYLPADALQTVRRSQDAIHELLDTQATHDYIDAINTRVIRAAAPPKTRRDGSDAALQQTQSTANQAIKALLTCAGAIKKAYSQGSMKELKLYLNAHDCGDMIFQGARIKRKHAFPDRARWSREFVAPGSAALWAGMLQDGVVFEVYGYVERPRKGAAGNTLPLIDTSHSFDDPVGRAAGKDAAEHVKSQVLGFPCPKQQQESTWRTGLAFFIDYAMEHGKQPTSKELAEELSLSPEDAEDLREQILEQLDGLGPTPGEDDE